MATAARLANVMADPPAVTRLAPGKFSVDVGGRREIVYVAGPPDDRRAFWNGHLFQSNQEDERKRQPEGFRRIQVAPSLSAPMPATVIRVLVAPSTAIKKGDVV